MKFKSVMLFLLLWQTAIAFAAPIKVDVDRKTVRLNESFQIIFSTTEEPDGEPDFNALSQDFEIIDKSQGSNLSIVNGVTNRTVQWTLNVMAKRAGHLEIPSVPFGKDLSPALKITVTEGNPQTNETASNNHADLFLEVEASPTKPYIQTQVIYTLRFFRKVNIAEASLKDPEIADAVVTKLDEDRNYKTDQNGEEYVVTERKYAIFPQKSGTLTIPSLTLTAAVVRDDPSGFGGFFNMRGTRTERVASKPITLTVLPTPTNFKGNWLAAERLELTQQWSDDINNIKVGEPVTRTLTLTAKGTTVGQLPKLQQATSNDDLKTYPDQPKTEEQKNSDGIVAIREEKVAFIASKAGTYTLPAVEIPWFNVQTQKTEIAKIPATIIVASGVGKIADTTQATPTVEKQVDKPSIIANPQTVNIQPKQVDNSIWQWLTAFFALAWLVTLALFFTNRKETQPIETVKNPVNPVNQINRVLKQACTDNDAMAAKQTLIAWGQQKYSVSTLGALAEFCDARLRDEILLLNRHLYSQQEAGWEGKRLFQAFSEHRAMDKAKLASDDKLEPLHRI
jgi:hypothetical protein